MPEVADMNEEIARAALRATSKLILSSIVAAGCGGSTSTETLDSNSTRLASTEVDPLPDASGDVDPLPEPSCSHLLTSDCAPQSEKVACCEKLIELSWGFDRECCQYLQSIGSTNDALSRSCTPWGPPIPPAMPALLEVA